MTEADQTIIEQELMPCPFCGDTYPFSERADLSSSYVVCNNCRARGPVECQDNDDEDEPGRASAIAAWNTRTLQSSAVLPSEAMINDVIAAVLACTRVGNRVADDSPALRCDVTSAKTAVRAAMRATTPTAQPGGIGVHIPPHQGDDSAGRPEARSSATPTAPVQDDDAESDNALPRTGLSEHAMRPLPKDDARRVIWGSYRLTDDYANTRRWALKEEHVDGSLWAAFIAGWRASRLSPTPETGLVEALTKCATALNSFIYIIAQRFDGDGSYYWTREPTHEEAQAAMEANNNACTALSNVSLSDGRFWT